MPPKQKKEEKKQPEPEPEDGAERELVEKELVIGYLKSKLGRYQEHGDQLQIENFKLSEDLETQKLNLRDINEFLTNELKARSLTTSALEAKVYELNQLMEEVRKNHEAALNKLRADKDKEADGLKAIIAEFEKKAKAMQDFLERKDSLEAELASLKAELAAKVKDYEYRLTDMDRSHIQDREKWKRETLSKIKETKIQMMKLTDNQLEMTTKRTIMENEQMSIELSYQSRQTEKLMSKNTVLTEENSDLRRQIALSKQTEQELARRNNVYQKTIKSLLTKLKEQSSEQHRNDTLVKAVESQNTELETQLQLAQLQIDELMTQAEQLQAKVHEKSAAMESMSSQYDDTARFLVQCLEDARSKIVTVSVQRTNTIGRSNTLPSTSEHQGVGDSGGAGQPGTQDEWGDSSSPSCSAVPTHGRSPSSVISPVVDPSSPDPMQGGTQVSVVPGRMEELNPEQRERVLLFLLERLNIHMQQRAADKASVAGSASAIMSTHRSTSRTDKSGVSGSVAAGGVQEGAAAGGVILPPIPAYPRKSPTSSTPISHGLVGGPAPVQQVMLGRGSQQQVHSVGQQGHTIIAVMGTPTASGDQGLHHSGHMHVQGVSAGSGHTVHPVPAAVSSSWPQPGAAPGASLAPNAGMLTGTGSPRTLMQQHQIAQGTMDPTAVPNSTDSSAQPQGQLQGVAPLPPVDDLLSKVMSDVRPWGKRAPDSPLVSGGLASTNGRGSVFVKRGGVGSGSSSSPRVKS